MRGEKLQGWLACQREAVDQIFRNADDAEDALHIIEGLEHTQHNRLVLLSGGMDSAILLAAEADDLQSAAEANEDDYRLDAVFFDYGQANRDPELQAARAICTLLSVPLVVRKLPDLVKLVGSGRSLRPGAVIPGRNLAFCAIGANLVHLAGGGSVILGACAEDQKGFPDCRPGFIDALNLTLGACELDAAVEVPLAHLRKEEAIERNRHRPKIQEALRLSYSCYQGDSDPCQKCPACLKREHALKAGGIS